jgi:hypothetical protein
MYEMERPRPAARQLQLRLLSAVAAYWPSTQVLGTTGKPVARYSRLRFPVPRVSPEAGFPGVRVPRRLLFFTITPACLTRLSGQFW